VKPETMKMRAEKAPQPSPWSVDKQGDRYAVLDANGFWVCDVGRDRADAVHIATSHPQAVIDLVTQLEAMTAARDELAALAETLSNNIVKFPATGGPTMADRRIAELRKVGAK
jgi:hypothetical protein